MPGRPLSIAEKVDLSTALEDLFSVPRIDLVSLPDADPFLALEIVKGELLHAADETFEAEYQLYIMRRADEFRHYREETLKQTLGF
ncbi:MAG: hypothetical protein FJ109_01250 [Deltaproteobacteria bacterium]|nr:hypothetical protein [Deltaproteobacteria bacterium]